MTQLVAKDRQLDKSGVFNGESLKSGEVAASLFANLTTLAIVVKQSQTALVEDSIFVGTRAVFS